MLTVLAVDVSRRNCESSKRVLRLMVMCLDLLRVAVFDWNKSIVEVCITNVVCTYILFPIIF